MNAMKTMLTGSTTTPRHRVWLGLLLAVCLLGSQVAFGQTIYLGVSIQGIQVTDANSNDVLNDGGSVKCDRRKRTLTLTNAKIKATGAKAGIWAHGDLIAIYLVGENTIESENEFGIRSDKEVRIEGPNGASLRITSKKWGITTDGATLSIKGGCYVSVKGGYKGVEQTGFLEIEDGSTLRAQGGEGSVFHVARIKGDYSAIQTPLDGKFEVISWGGGKTSGHVVDGNGKVVTSEVVIGPSLYVAGTPVTAANAKNVMSNVSYDATSKVLTLKGASFAAPPEIPAIRSYVEGLTIALEGENYVKSTTSGLSLKRATTIRGGAASSLKVISDATGISYYNCPLTVKGGCSVTVNSKLKGIEGMDGTTEELNVYHSTLRVTGSQEGSIVRLKRLGLDGCGLTSPAGAVFKGPSKGVCDASGTLIKGEVVIEPTLWVKGVMVTRENAGNVLKDSRVKYDFASKTLTLDRATINATGGDAGIASHVEGLTIELKGASKITSGTGNGIWLVKSGRIRGASGSSVTVNSTYLSGILAAGNLGIEGGCSVTATGKVCGVKGNGAATVLTVSGSTLRATGGEKGSIAEIKELNMKGLAITAPNNAFFWGGSKGVVDGGYVTITQEVVIEPIKLWVGGTQVDSENCHDVLGDGGVEYAIADRILVLRNANIVPKGSDYGIRSAVEGLKIWLAGNNTVSSTRTSAIVLERSTIIKGFEDASLIATTKGPVGISLQGANLSIEGGVTVVTEGESHGISGSVGAKEVLTVSGSELRATGAGNGSIANIKSLVMEYCAIASPRGATYQSAVNGVADASGKLVKSRISIRPTLSVNGHYVTSYNANDILKDGGSVYYMESTKTLCLIDALIEPENGCGVLSSVDGLTIRLVGNNAISGRGESALGLYGPTIIRGDGTSTLTATSTSAAAIHVDKSRLSIEGGCTVIAKSQSRGISGAKGDEKELSVVGSTLRATGKGYASIEGFNRITLSGCELMAPAGATFSESAKGYVDAEGKLVKEEVVIANGVPFLSITKGIKNGVLRATPHGLILPGTEVELVATPAEGFQLKAGSLMAYMTSDGPDIQVTVKDGKLTMPKFDVTVTCEFEAKGTTPASGGTQPTRISISGPETLTVKDKISLELVVEPAEASKEVEWLVEPDDLATIVSGSLLEALKPGTVTVQAVSTENRLASNTLTITIKEKSTTPTGGTATPTGIEITSIRKTMKVGERQNVEARLTPSDAIATLTWSVAPGNLAKIDESGLLTATGEGTVTVRVASSVASGIFAMEEVVISGIAEGVDVTPVSTEVLAWRVGVDGRSLMVYGAEGRPLEVYSVMGVRLVHVSPVTHEPYRVTVPQAGVYVVRVGNSSRKVVVQ